MVMITDESRCWVLRNAGDPLGWLPIDEDGWGQHYADAAAAGASLRRLIGEYPGRFAAFGVVELDYLCVSMTCDACGSAVGQEEEGVTFHFPGGAEAEHLATAWGWRTNGRLWMCEPCREDQPIDSSWPAGVAVPGQLPLDLAG
jgi:hypothetical protein